MHRLRILLVAVATASAGISSGFAQAPAQPSAETLAAAKSLVALISHATAAEMTANMTAKVWPQIEAALRAQFPKIDDATLGEMRGEYEGLLNKTVADAMNDAPAIYARYFSAAEMNEIAAFYRTPTGAKALTVMPKALADMTPALLARIGAMKGELNGAFEKTLAKHGYKAK